MLVDPHSRQRTLYFQQPTEQQATTFSQGSLVSIFSGDIVILARIVIPLPNPPRIAALLICIP